MLRSSLYTFVFVSVTIITLIPSHGTAYKWYVRHPRCGASYVWYAVRDIFVFLQHVTRGTQKFLSCRLVFDPSFSESLEDKSDGERECARD